ncbi:MAG: hypothetical protein H7099_03390 [Gemmatimonadaceae bacterium]|nr:hypothetical protein [Gemmatimonadaceae bacterium]
MPPRPVRPVAPTLSPIVLPGAIIPIRNSEWFRPLRPGIKLPPGEIAPDLLRIPVKDADAVMRGIIHLVADIAANTRPSVVWVAGDDELLVQLDATRLTCAPGFITISLFVQCDEVRDVQRIDVAFAVGSPQRPTGLVMSTFDRPQGPAVILDTWGASITAFAWETLVTTAQQLAAGVGKDASGRPLVPGTIAADTNLLLIGAMARNNLAWAGQ